MTQSTTPDPVPVVQATVAEMSLPKGDSLIVGRASAMNRVRDFGILVVALGLFFLAFMGWRFSAAQTDAQKDLAKETAEAVHDDMTKVLDKLTALEREVVALRSSMEKKK